MAIDSYKYVDFATRQIMKAWASRQEPGVIPFTPLAKPLRECTVALLSTAGIARNDDRPFDQDGERRDPWWGDPSFRRIPLGTTEKDIRIYHLHIDPKFGRPAPTHYSTMGYILEPTELVEKTAPAIAAGLHDEGVDVVVLVPV